MDLQEAVFLDILKIKMHTLVRKPENKCIKRKTPGTTIPRNNSQL